MRTAQRTSATESASTPALRSLEATLKGRVGSENADLTVMIVEDEALVAMELEAHISSAGMHVVGIADHFDAALTLYDETRPDVVLMDVNIFGQRDGIETAAAIQEHGETPVVFLTAYEDDEVMNRIQNVSAYGYVCKPVDPSTLQMAVRLAAAQHQSHIVAEVLSTTLMTGPTAVVIADPSRPALPIVYANAAWETLVGQSVPDFIGRPLWQPLLRGDDPALVELLDDIEHRREADHLVRVPAPSGGMRALEVAHRVLPTTQSGARALQIVHMTDKSELVSYETALTGTQIERTVALRALELVHKLERDISGCLEAHDASPTQVTEHAKKLRATHADLIRKIRDFDVALQLSLPANSFKNRLANLAEVARDALALIKAGFPSEMAFTWQLNAPTAAVQVPSEVITLCIHAAVQGAVQEKSSIERLEVILNPNYGQAGELTLSGVSSAALTITVRHQPGAAGNADLPFALSDETTPKAGALGLVGLRSLLRRFNGDAHWEHTATQTSCRLLFPLSEYIDGPSAASARPERELEGVHVGVVCESVLLRAFCARLLKEEGAHVTASSSCDDILEPPTGQSAPDIVVIDARIGATNLRKTWEHLDRRPTRTRIIAIVPESQSLVNLPVSPRWVVRLPVTPEKVIARIKTHLGDQSTRITGLKLTRSTALSSPKIPAVALRIRREDDSDPRHQRFSEALSKLHMVFQPIVTASSRKIFGYEALMRSTHPELSSPLDILAEAERLSRLSDVAQMVFEKTAQVIEQNPRNTDTIFVNLHPDDLANINLLEGSPLHSHAHRIVLEVTERARLSDNQLVERRIHALRHTGYRLAIDDLGEGYAGLKWLVNLAPDIAKLDMSLSRSIDRIPFKQEVVSALAAVCKASRNTVLVAEGVETAEEAKTLDALGCDLLQGFYFSRPAPPFVTLR